MEHENTGNLRAALNHLLPTLKGNNVVEVAIYYEGCGDEGVLKEEDITFRDKEGTALKLPGEAIALLMGAADTILEEKYGGWGLDSGSFGTIILNVESGKVRIEHTWRSTDDDFTEFQL